MKTTVFDATDPPHGTQIAGVIAASSPENDIYGVADNVMIMPLKFIEDGYGYTSDAIAAIQYAAENGAKIINCSWGSDEYNPILKDIIQHYSDILFVCAAGNSGNTKPIYPAAFNLPNVISVASINNTGALSTRSSYGPTVTIAAPGTDIYTTFPSDTYGFAEGTSLAAAYVTGVAGLCLGKDENLTPRQVKNAIIGGATPWDELSGRVNTGGFLNALGALEYEAPEPEMFEEEYPIEVAAIIESGRPYSALTEEEKDLFVKYMHLRRDTMTACAEAGLSIKESINKARIMQRLNISLDDALRMIRNHNGEHVALIQATHLNSMFIDYSYLNSYNASNLASLVASGYKARDVVYSFIAAQAAGVDHETFITKTPFDWEYLSHYLFSDSEHQGMFLYSEEDISILKELVGIYALDYDALVQHLAEQNMTPAEFKDFLQKYRFEQNLFMRSSAIQPLNSTHPEIVKGRNYPETPFVFNNGTNEGINLSTGALAYEDRIAVIPGVNGLDLELALQYDSGNSNIEKMYGIIEYIPQYRYRIYALVTTMIAGKEYGPDIIEVSSSFTYDDAIWAIETDWNPNFLGKLLSWPSPSNDPRRFWLFFTDDEYEPSMVFYDNEFTNKYNSTNDLDPAETPFEYMGAGWQLKFSRVIIDDKTKEKFLRLPNGSTHKYQKDITGSNLKNYLLQDIKFEEDPNGLYPGSKYMLTYSNGSREYFDGKGRIIGIVDKYNNTIDFNHNINSLYNGTTTIKDSAGQTTDIIYTSNSVTIKLPDGNDVVYFIDWKSSNKVYAQVLSKKTDQLGRETNFTYLGASVAFNLFTTSGYAGNASNLRHMLLYSVEYPTGASTEYRYTIADGNIGGPEGRTQYFRITERHDLAGGILYNRKDYRYTNNNYTGFPTNKDHETLDSSFTYGITEYCYGNGVSKDYTYNNKHLIRDMSFYRQPISPLNPSREKVYEENFEYDANKLLATSSRTIYGKSVNHKTTELFTYDHYGNLTEYWGKEAGGDRADTEYKRTMTYDQGFNLLTSITYKKDNATTIYEEYALTADKKSIDKIKVFVNGSQVSQTDFAYNNRGNITSKKEYISSNKSVLTAYDYQNHVFINSETRAGITANSTYDVFGNLLTYTDRNGNTTSYEYDDVGRNKKITNPDQTVIGLDYNDAARTVVITDEIGRKAKYSHDVLGNLTLVQDITGSLTIDLKTYEYDTLMRLRSEKDSKNTPTIYTYDHLSRLTSKTIGAAPVLYKETYDYEDVFDETLSKTTKTIEGETNAPSIKTYEYTDIYGKAKNIGRVINNKEYSNTLAYDYLGNITGNTSPDGKTTQFHYDHAGRPTKTINPNNSVYQQAYDWLGRKARATDALGNIVEFEYDDFNNLKQEKLPFTDNAKTIKSYDYDNNGNVTSTKITNNKPGSPLSESRTDYEYDNRNNLRKVLLFDNGTVKSYTTYDYDDIGNILEMATANETQITKYEYDDQGRLKRITDPLGNIETYHEYDSNNNLISKTDRNGNTFTYKYDLLNRLTGTAATTPTGSPAAEYQNYAYAKTGAIIQERNENLTIDYEYDNAGRLRKQTETNGIVKAYDYDELDNCRSFTLAQNGVTRINQAYEYDDMNRLEDVRRNGALIATYGYDLNGNRKSLTYGNGVTVEYDYNNANLVRSLVNKKGATVLSSYSYTYYLDGNQASKLDHTGRVTNYEYDGLGRLKTEAETGPSGILTMAYTFDPAGNRETMTVTGMENYTTNYDYDLNNRLLTEKKTIVGAVESKSYHYDKNGNQISMLSSVIGNPSGAPQIGVSLSGSPGSAWAYELSTYDVFNRLTQVINDKGIAQYSYRSDGLRLSKTVSGEKTTHIWDGMYIVMDLDGSNNVKDIYTYGIGLIASTVNYYLYNAHGDVVQLTDGTGAVTKEYHYDAFGNERKPVEIGSVTITQGLPESAHPYANRFDHTWTYSYPGASSLEVTFSSDTETERNWDWIYIYDEFNNQIGARYSGTELAGKTITVPGDTVKIRLQTDPSITRYGFRVTSIVANGVSAGSGNGQGSNLPDLPDTNPFRYCGEYFDSETGTYYLRARYYNPSTGRFRNEDPHWNIDNMILGDKPRRINKSKVLLGMHTYTLVPEIKAIIQSSNLYVYCMSNPLKFIDPSGEITFAIGGEAAAAFLLRLGVSGQLVIDDKGNFGIILSGEGGGGTPAASISGTFTMTNADTIFDLSGLGFGGGGSAAFGLPISLGIDVIGGATKNGIPVYGGQIVIGASTPWPEGHGFLSYSGVISLNWLPNWLKNEISDIINRIYNTMTPEQQEALWGVVGG